MNNETSGRGLGDQPSWPATTPERAGSQPGAGSAEGATDRSLQQAVREDLDELRQFADERTEEAKEAVSRIAEDEKNLTARQLSGVAMALEKVGVELEQTDQRALGRYAKQMGSSLQGFARDIDARLSGHGGDRRIGRQSLPDGLVSSTQQAERFPTIVAIAIAIGKQQTR